MNYTLFSSLISLFFLTNCVEYQYVSLQSSLPQNEARSFTNENDTASITYSFSGNNCPVNIEVYNKLNVPIYVDWRRSSLIINEETIPYWRDQQNFSSVGQGSEWRPNQYISFQEQQTDGVIIREDAMSFIPPKSYVKVSPILVRSDLFEISKDTEFRNVIGRDGISHGKRYKFDQQNTPLSFRSYIAISATSDLSTLNYKDDTFWVSEITESSSEILKKSYQSPNQFQIRKKDTESANVLIVVLGGILILASTTN